MSLSSVQWATLPTLGMAATCTVPFLREAEGPLQAPVPGCLHSLATCPGLGF